MGGRSLLGKRSKQRGLFEADTMYGDFVGEETFYGWLASERGRLLRLAGRSILRKECLQPLGFLNRQVGIVHVLFLPSGPMGTRHSGGFRRPADTRFIRLSTRGILRGRSR